MTFSLAALLNAVMGGFIGAALTWLLSVPERRRLSEHVSEVARHHANVHESFKVLARGFVQMQRHPGTVEFRFQDDERLIGLFHDVDA